MARGEIVAQPGHSFEVPGFGRREFRAHNLVITGPPLVFTKANIDNYNF